MGDSYKMQTELDIAHVAGGKLDLSALGDDFRTFLECQV
jgi:hypothetical protein